MQARRWLLVLVWWAMTDVASAQAPDPSVPPPPPPPPPAAATTTTTPWSAATEGAASAPQPLRDVSLTFSPLHVIGGPIVEITVEVRAHDNFGIAFLGGAGRMKFKRSDGSTSSFAAYELGASLRGYPVGDYDHGLQLGAELLWIHVSLDKEADIKGSAGGVAVGPMIGYKYTAKNGFTFDGQLGVQWFAVRAEATDGVDTDSEEASGVLPLLNLNIGWSF